MRINTKKINNNKTKKKSSLFPAAVYMHNIIHVDTALRYIKLSHTLNAINDYMYTGNVHWYNNIIYTLQHNNIICLDVHDIYDNA